MQVFRSTRCHASTVESGRLATWSRSTFTSSNQSTPLTVTRHYYQKSSQENGEGRSYFVRSVTISLSDTVRYRTVSAPQSVAVRCANECTASRPASRTATAAFIARIHRGRDADAGARHWRQRGDLHRRPGGAHSSASIPGS